LRFFRCYKTGQRGRHGGGGGSLARLLGQKVSDVPTSHWSCAVYTMFPKFAIDDDDDALALSDFRSSTSPQKSFARVGD
jgi:hypothetical protein